MMFHKIFFGFVLKKIIIQMYIMIKNKIVNIKMIFKTYLKKIKNMLKIILDFQRDFYSIKYQRRFSKVIF